MHKSLKFLSFPKFRRIAKKLNDKSHQEQTQDGKKKEEINPNNPKANQNSRQGSENNQGSASIKGETKSTFKDDEEEEEETTGGNTSGKTSSQNQKK